ncbi:hypothetical protein ACTXT7_010698 [Hymenolepis weldensis]
MYTTASAANLTDIDMKRTGNTTEFHWRKTRILPVPSLLARLNQCDWLFRSLGVRRRESNPRPPTWQMSTVTNAPPARYEASLVNLILFFIVVA